MTELDVTLAELSQLVGKAKAQSAAGRTAEDVERGARIREAVSKAREDLDAAADRAQEHHPEDLAAQWASHRHYLEQALLRLIVRVSPYAGPSAAVKTTPKDSQ